MIFYRVRFYETAAIVTRGKFIMAAKARPFAKAFIVSSACNLLLLCICLALVVDGGRIHFALRPFQPRLPRLAPALMQRLTRLSFEQLVALLDDKRAVGGSYRICDFALAALESWHDFDVDRGLKRAWLSKVFWEWEGQRFFFIRSLLDEDFKELRSFAKRELFPFTPKGLFVRIANQGIDKSDPELIRFFCHTPHFILLETLFARTHLPIRKRDVLMLALECGWEKLEAFYKRQQDTADFSAEQRICFLLEGIELGAKSAAYLLLITDPEFASENLSDDQIMRLLNLCSVPTQEVAHFAKKIATSARRAPVRELAHAFSSGGGTGS